MVVHWTVDAVANLNEMFDNSTYTEEDTRAFVNSFYQRADQLKHSPFSGPMIPEYNREDVRELIHKKHRIVYRTLTEDRKSTRLNSSHVAISYAVFCLKKKIVYTSMYKNL